MRPLGPQVEPVEGLMRLLQTKYPVIDAAYRNYAHSNSRAPYTMSVASWLAMAKDAQLDAIVAFGRTEPAASQAGGKVLSRKAEVEAAAEAAEAAAEVDEATGLGREAKMALEVIFYTATGSEEEDKGGAPPPPPAGAAVPSPLTLLQFSKHDMRRAEFVLGLLAMTRYRQVGVGGMCGRVDACVGVLLHLPLFREFPKLKAMRACVRCDTVHPPPSPSPRCLFSS